MATAKIIFEIWDTDMKKCESTQAFDSVGSFLAHAWKFKNRKDPAILRVHISGGFDRSGNDIEKINNLGISRF